MPTNLRYKFIHATAVVPSPRKGSRTRSFLAVRNLMQYSASVILCPHLWNRLPGVFDTIKSHK